MAHVEHFKASDVKRLCNEYEREKEFNNADGRVDPSRTPLNYTVPRRRIRYQLSYDLPKRVEQVPHANRKDLNVMSTWVVTLPEQLKGADDATKRRFFETAYRYTQDRYGSENVMNGYVHMDESTPHMHIPTVPVDRNGRISSRNLYTRTELSEYHKGLEAAITKEFGMPGLILNGRTKGKYTVKELKERTRQEKEIGDKRRAAEEYAEQVKKDASRMKTEAQIKLLDAEALYGKVEKAAEALKGVLGENWDNLPPEPKKTQEDAFTAFSEGHTLTIRLKSGDMPMNLTEITGYYRKHFAYDLEKKREAAKPVQQAVKAAEDAMAEERRRDRILHPERYAHVTRHAAMPELSGAGVGTSCEYH